MRRGLLLLSMMSLAMMSVGCATFRGPAPEPISVIASYSDPETNPAIKPVPVSGRFEPFFIQRHNQIQQNISDQDRVDLLLVGDSITHFWEPWAPESFEKFFGNYHPINFGIAGDQTQHVLWRLENTDFGGKKPRVCTVMIGTNNMGGDRYSEEQIADGVIEICRKLRTDFPKAKILLLGIFPRADADNNPTLKAKIAATNALIQAVADERIIHYRDLTKHFLTEEGTLDRGLFPDGIHPRADGYDVWGEAMEEDVARLMGDGDL